MLKLLSNELSNIVNLDIFLASELPQISQLQINSDLYSSNQNEPYLELSKGLICGFVANNNTQPWSLSVDLHNPQNEIPSSITQELKTSKTWFTPQLKEQTLELMQKITDLEIAQYNQAQILDPLLLTQISEDKEKLLIVNQNYNTPVNSQLTPAALTNLLIKELKSKYADSTIYVVDESPNLTNPCFELETMRQSGLKIKTLEPSFNPIAVCKLFNQVFTIDSMWGFYALLLNKEVHCWGEPFYAGLNLSTDHVEYESLKQKHSIQEIDVLTLFYVKFIKHGRYLNPISQQLTSLNDLISLVAQQKQAFNQTYKDFVVLGASYWKKDIFRKFLTGAKSIRFTRNPKKAIKLCKKYNATLVQWASKRSATYTKLVKEQNIPLIYAEDGFIRSIGLGSNHQRPFSLVFDTHGIYYDPQSNSDLETILNNLKSHPDFAYLVKEGQKLKQFLVENQLTKYNVGHKDQAKLEELKQKLPANKEIILVPGQVESDASVKYGGGNIKTNAQLLVAVRKNAPDAFVIYKPHPDVLAANREEDTQEIAQDLFDLEVRDISISSLYNIVDSIHTLCSQSGFEGLLRNKKVCVYGAPFYAGWGLTQDVMEIPHRTNKLTIDELCAGTLILYPRYFDWCTDLICRAEDISYRFLHPKPMPKERLSVRTLHVIYGIKRKIIKSFKKR